MGPNAVSESEMQEMFDLTMCNEHKRHLQMHSPSLVVLLHFKTQRRSLLLIIVNIAYMSALEAHSLQQREIHSPVPPPASRPPRDVLSGDNYFNLIIHLIGYPLLEIGLLFGLCKQ